MTLIEKIEQLLEDTGQPLHYREISTRLIQSGSWRTDGKTPEATVNAQIVTSMQKNGDRSRFIRLEKGVYGLRSIAPDPDPPEPPVSTTLPPPPPQLPKTSLSFLDAAERVLDEDAERKPMHYRLVTQRAMARGWITTNAKTPEATLSAQISVDIANQQKRGTISRFTRYGKGLIGLSRWETTGLVGLILQHNASIRKRLHAQVSAMPPAEFEVLISRLLVALGFEDAAVTPYHGDDGIDVRGTLVVGGVVRTRMAVQVKRWKSNVQSPTVQQVRGSLGAHERGLIITTSGFSKGAIEEAVRPDRDPIALMDGDQLVTLLIEHDIGVHRSSYDLIELGEDDIST